MKAFIVKYALTKGIYEQEGHLVDEWFICEDNTQCNEDNYAFTLEEAKELAEYKRYEKIESLKRKIKTLERKKIKVIE